MANAKAKDFVAEEIPVEEIPMEAPPVEEIPVTPVKPAPQESIYTAEDLIANYKAFKTSREIVVVALRLAGKKTATFSEAKTIIESFKNKEVK